MPLEAIPAFEEQPVAFLRNRRGAAVPSSSLKQVWREAFHIVRHRHAFLDQGRQTSFMAARAFKFSINDHGLWVERYRRFGDELD